MIDCIQKVIGKYYSNPRETKAHKENLQCYLKIEACDSCNLGLLLRTFKEFGVYPEAYEVTSTTSIQGLSDLLTQDYAYPKFLLFRHNHCPDCTPEKDKCHSCNGKKWATRDHTQCCSPIPKIHEEIRHIVERVEGLELSNFVRSSVSNDERNRLQPSIREQGIWDYLHYW